MQHFISLYGLWPLVMTDTYLQSRLKSKDSESKYKGYILLKKAAAHFNNTSDEEWIGTGLSSFFAAAYSLMTT